MREYEEIETRRVNTDILSAMVLTSASGYITVLCVMRPEQVRGLRDLPAGAVRGPQGGGDLPADQELGEQGGAANPHLLCITTGLIVFFVTSI